MDTTIILSVRYFIELSRQPFFKYLIIEYPDRRFFGIVDARALTELLPNPNDPYRSDDLARWFNQSDTKALARLPDLSRKAMRSPPAPISSRPCSAWKPSVSNGCRRWMKRSVSSAWWSARASRQAC